LYSGSAWRGFIQISPPFTDRAHGASRRVMRKESLVHQTFVLRFARWSGFTLAVLTAVGLALNTTALPAVLDVRAAVLIISAAAIPLLGIALATARSAPVRALAAGALLLSGTAAAAMLWDLRFAYRTEAVSFSSGEVTLRGSLYLPTSEGPHPAVVLLHGSGRQTRDEYAFYARQYAKRGIAALAYDKRGSGESTGDVRTATYEVLAADAVSAIDMLRLREDILPQRVGLWGLSEGEWVAPLAAITAKPAFLVLVSPSAMTPGGQVQYETGANVLRAGFSQEDARRARELYARLAAFQRTGAGRDALNDDLRQASTLPWFAAARYLESSVPEYEKVLALDWFPAWRSRMDFDALPLLARIDCPVLAQAGGSDPKNDGAAALNRIRTALAAGGNDAFSGVLYSEAGHGIVEWRLPFGFPPPWFADGYLDTQLDWVARQVSEH
jgi:alpha-beta hydrolase superfamily lysophospholipase